MSTLTTIPSVGHWVFALDTTEDTTADLDAVQGGVVFAVVSSHRPETGEKMDRFRTVRPIGQGVAFGSLWADQVMESREPRRDILLALIRALCRTVGAKRKGAFTDRETRCLDALWPLAREVVS